MRLPLESPLVPSVWPLILGVVLIATAVGWFSYDRGYHAGLVYGMEKILTATECSAP